MKSAYNQMGTTGGGTSLFSSGNDHDTAQKSQGEIRLLKGDRAPLETFPGQHPQAFPPRKGSVPELNHGVGTVGDGNAFAQSQAYQALRTEPHAQLNRSPRPQRHAVF